MKKTLLTGALLLATTAIFAQPQLTKDNIDEVLGAMTLEEKATLLVGSGWGSMTAGSMTASATALVPGAAGTTRAIERLGVTQAVLADGPAGLRISPRRDNDPATYYCTGFPVGTVMAPGLAGAFWAQTEQHSGCGAASTSQGHRDPDSLRRRLVWAGKHQLGNAAWGASFPSERALPAGGFGSVHTPSP